MEGVKESTGTGYTYKFVAYEDFEQFKRHVDHSFVKRQGKKDLTMAIIHIEENFTKFHFDEAVEILLGQYRDVLTFCIDMIVACVGKLATDQGEVATHADGRHQAEVRSCVATVLLECMINKVNAEAPSARELCSIPMVFGNADPCAALAALAASSDDVDFPQDVDYQLSNDGLLMYYLDWKKSDIT